MRSRRVNDRPIVLGLETSCDETAAALLRGPEEVLGHIILSQDIHELNGGVVPELAARAHIRTVTEVVDAALEDAGLEIYQDDLYAGTEGTGQNGRAS